MNDQDQVTTTETAQPSAEDQAIANFEAGFAGRDTETPPETDETANETTEAEAPAPKYVQITEEQFARLSAAADGLEALRATVEKSNGTAFGKIGGIERRLQELATRGIQMPAEKLARLRDELPEIAEVFDSIQVSSPAFDEDGLLEKMRERIKPDDLVSQAESKAWKRFAEARANELHPDWKQISATPEFGQFAQGKGHDYVTRLAKAADEWDYLTVCGAISEFKDARKKAAAKTEAQRSRMDATTPRGIPAPSAVPKSRLDNFQAGFNEGRV